MAKKNSIEDALNEILNPKRLNAIVQDVTKDAGQKARKDLVAQANKIVKHYYDEYPERKFEPTYALYKSFVNYDWTKDNYINFGVEFQSSILKNKHEINILLNTFQTINVYYKEQNIHSKRKK